MQIFVDRSEILKLFKKREFLVKQFFFSHPSILMPFNQKKTQKPRECHAFPDSTPWKLGHVNVSVNGHLLLWRSDEMWEVPGCGSTRGKNLAWWKLLSFFGGIFRDTKRFPLLKLLIPLHVIWAYAGIFCFSTWKSVFGAMEGLPKILGFFQTFNSIISFSRNAREVVLFFGGVERLFLRFVK